MEKYTSFHPGQVWLDTDGNRIQAHGGNIIFHEGKFWWFGENKEYSQTEWEIWHWGVRLYSSEDLYNWKNEGLMAPPDLDDVNSPMHPLSKMDRPHVLYNEKNKEFVMWVKIMGDNGRDQYMVILTSPDIRGPFKIKHSVHPGGFLSGDFDLVKDPDTGIAYIMFERVHCSMIIMPLTEDFTDVTGEYTEFFEGRRVPFVREAPAIFRRNNKWYMFTSGTTAKFPNPTESASADSLTGPWTEHGESCIGDVKRTTFDSQVACVIKIPGKDLYIAAADRWLLDIDPSWPNFMDVFDSWYDKTKTPLLPQDMKKLTAKNTSIADYVWLPVSFDEDGVPRLKWYDEWRWEDFV